MQSYPIALHRLSISCTNKRFVCCACRMKFVVHPTEFVVHMPHKESAARLMIIDPANAALRDKVLRMLSWSCAVIFHISPLWSGV